MAPTRADVSRGDPARGLFGDRPGLLQSPRRSRVRLPGRAWRQSRPNRDALRECPPLKTGSSRRPAREGWRCRTPSPPARRLPAHPLGQARCTRALQSRAGRTGALRARALRPPPRDRDRSGAGLFDLPRRRPDKPQRFRGRRVGSRERPRWRGVRRRFHLVE